MLLNDLIDNVISLNITKGVQPSELTEAIFDDSYISINMKKDSLSNLCLELSFMDDEENKNIHVMRYKYDPNGVLFRIEQKINKGKYSVQWDREEILLTLYSEIKNELLNNNFSNKAIEDIMSELPALKSYDSEELLKILA